MSILIANKPLYIRSTYIETIGAPEPHADAIASRGGPPTRPTAWAGDDAIIYHVFYLK